MGGSGSGRYYFSGKKTKVEDCLSLDMRNFSHGGHIWNGRSHGTTDWKNAWGQITDTISWEIMGYEDYFVTFCLMYSVGSGENRENMDYTIPLDHTFLHFGGFRWWFTCPLVNNGRHCGRRVRKLYLPPGARYFGCRRCYNLTYKSCQESHKLERSVVFGGLIGMFNLDTKIELLHRKIKRWSYRGKPTKKASKFFRMVRKLETLYGNIDEEAISRGVESWKEESQ